MKVDTGHILVKKACIRPVEDCQRLPARSIFTKPALISPLFEIDIPIDSRLQPLVWRQLARRTRAKFDDVGRSHRDKTMSDSRYMNTLDKIQSHLERLSKSERKVAEVILASPQTAIPPALPRWPMADVSEPTVNRFAAALIPKAFRLQTASRPKPG